MAAKVHLAAVTAEHQPGEPDREIAVLRGVTPARHCDRAGPGIGREMLKRGESRFSPCLAPATGTEDRGGRRKPTSGTEAMF
jgi:hypothetical protein